VMPSSSAKGSTISAGALETRIHLFTLSQVVVHQLKCLGVEKRLNHVADRLFHQLADHVAVPPLGDLEHRGADLLQSLLVGAKALKPQLTEAGANKGPPMKETVGVQLRTERHERRFGDDRLI
jgi:hypothetical protein